MNRRTFNDHVELIHFRLIDDAGYRRYLSADCNAQAIEGSLDTDDIMAAKMIRDKAKEICNLEVGEAQLTAIAKALRVVVRRYRLSRKERRELTKVQSTAAELTKVG